VPLQRDLFWEEARDRMTATGWVILNGHRYDPTHLDGLTPSGRVFVLDITQAGVVTLDVAGRTRAAQITPTQRENGADAVTAILAAWNTLPAGQR
jgi:hypothetical protein